MMNRLILFLLVVLSAFQSTAKAQPVSLTVKTTVSESMREAFLCTGRIFLFVSESRMNQPRRNTRPDKGNMIFAATLQNWHLQDTFTFNAEIPLSKSVGVSLNQIPVGSYTIQVLWDQDLHNAGIDDPGNLYSESVRVELTHDQELELPLKYQTESPALAKHPLLKEVDLRSPLLSDWWRKEMRLKAAVLLPSGFYDEPDRKYPVRYQIGGYGSRYTRANRYVLWDKSFMEWWQSDESPQVIQVFLDGKGPLGDCYQMDSENSGPYGTALTEELIPSIESQFRGLGTPESRFLDGCSTGGWVSLALQLFYPDFFGGCFSYSPDPVDFEYFQLINIYGDQSAFVNRYGYPRPVMRDTHDEPVVSQKDFIRFENVLGRDGTYLTSGGQFGAFTALFSPKGKDGLPRPLFDPVSGRIDQETAQHWRRYDLKHYTETHWDTLGPKIQGKIHIWMGDRDEYYLNRAVHSFHHMLQNKENPESDAVIRFSPTAGHCDDYNDKDVLLMIRERISR
jgi:enterochelin esterase-like enzyme